MPLLKTNKHPRNRRQSSRSVQASVRGAIVTPTVSTVTVTLTYDQPMVFSGALPLFTVATVTVNSQTIVSSTVRTLTLSGSGAAKAWAQAANDPSARTMTGGYVAAASGTFP